MSETLITDWHGCYEGGWQGMIAAEAFSHPAKFSYSLICRIVRHGLDQGYWKPGDTIGDPFGGVATGGIVCGYHGLNWVGCELEPRFVELGNKNLDMHRQSWSALKQSVDVRLLQGDSRRFAEVVGSVPCGGCGECDEQKRCVGCLHEFHRISGVISSPPYADTFNANKQEDAGKGMEKRAETGGALCWGSNANGSRTADAYGASPGQIGSLKAGSLDGVISSPPWTNQNESGSDTSARSGVDENGERRGGATSYQYGTSAGQIGALKPGSIDGMISSPPYAESEVASACKSQNPDGRQGTYKRAHGHNGYADETSGQIGANKSGSLDGVVTSPPYCGTRMDGGGVREMDAPARKGYVYNGMRDGVHAQYSSNEAQISNVPETYWAAMKLVYASMHAAMKPGGVAAIVVKDYVKAKARVPLCDQTCTLLESLGFDVFERCRCWLVKERREPSLFGGEHVTTTERKSFFRRLAEKKGSPRIDWEEVIWCRK